MSYWDTSCLVKLYTPEADSSAFSRHLESSAVCITSDLTPLEFWATVRRKESEGVLAPGEARKVQNVLEADLAAGFITVQVSDLAVRIQFEAFVDYCHGLSPPIYIRTNDALHIAAARCAGATEIVATDKRLREAALALGFSVFPPR